LRRHQLPSAIALVKACPNTRFVLDHAAKPGIASAELDPWRADIERIAALPNVVCKLSGLVTEADPARWTVEALRPYVDHVLACFEVERVFLGSDWPVIKTASSYARWVDAARALVDPLPPSERRAVFMDNARRTYRLP